MGRAFFRIFLSFWMVFAVPQNGLAREDTGRILFMGDSLLAVHGLSGNAVSDVAAATLGEPVTDRSVAGARIIYGLPISGALGMKIAKQYRKGPWDWVVLNGGGNDLWLGCGCNRCERRLTRLISQDGQDGKIPKLVKTLRDDGARVLYVGYLRSPGVGSPIESCRDEGDVLEARISAMAAADDGVYFLSLADLVPYGDRSFHMVDMIHPSRKASAIIGRMIAEQIQAVGD